MIRVYKKKKLEYYSHPDCSVDPLKLEIPVYPIKAMDHTLFQFTGVKTHLGCWRSKENFVHHSLSARDHESFLVSSRLPAWDTAPANR